MDADRGCTTGESLDVDMVCEVEAGEGLLGVSLIGSGEERRGETRLRSSMAKKGRIEWTRSGEGKTCRDIKGGIRA